MDASELTVMDQENVYFAHEIMEEDSWMDSAIDSMTNNVYITLDLDAFDPSILPATGTPEPGGLGWYQMLDFLNRVFAEKNVVGFDIVELCPNEIDKSSDFLAAKLYYKMLSYKFMDLDEDEDYFDDEMSLNSIGNNSKYHTDDDY
jgi:agmatinase